MMRVCLSTMAVAAVLTLVPALTNEAQAQSSISPYGSGGFPGPGWIGYYGSPYSLGQIPVPPYFAIHPPVYYSYPVARSYGYSPYAYPGWMETPPVVMPEVIENPHVDQPEAQETKVLRTAYQVIENPYVSRGPKSSQLVQADK